MGLSALDFFAGAASVFSFWTCGCAGALSAPFFSFVGAGALVAVIFFLYQRNKKLYTMYRDLQSQAPGREDREEKEDLKGADTMDLPKTESEL